MSSLIGGGTVECTNESVTAPRVSSAAIATAGAGEYADPVIRQAETAQVFAQPVTYDPDVDSLTAILARCGYTQRRCGFEPGQLGYRDRDILNAAGKVVFTGSVDQTLSWLAETGQAVAVESAP